MIRFDVSVNLILQPPARMSKVRLTIPQKAPFVRFRISMIKNVVGTETHIVISAPHWEPLPMLIIACFVRKPRPTAVALNSILVGLEPRNAPLCHFQT